MAVYERRRLHLDYKWGVAKFFLTLSRLTVSSWMYVPIVFWKIRFVGDMRSEGG